MVRYTTGVQSMQGAWMWAAQDIILGCESEEAELRHASHTADGNSLRRTLSEVRKNGVVAPKR